MSLARLLGWLAPGPRSRRAELALVRRRLACGPAPRRAPAAELLAARALASLREDLVAATGDVEACARCGRGRPEPNGHWDGGFCCGAPTEDLFTEEEAGALRLAGVQRWRLRPPRGDHAGCAFRGARGCALPPRARPNVCVRHMCRDLQRELFARGRLDAVEALCAELDRQWGAYREARAARLAGICLVELDRYSPAP